MFRESENFSNFEIFLVFFLNLIAYYKALKNLPNFYKYINFELYIDKIRNLIFLPFFSINNSDVSKIVK